MSRVAILYGGRSVEHEVSCRTAASVLSHLNPSHEVLLIGVNREGQWHLQDLPSPLPSSLETTSDEKRRVGILPGRGLTDALGRKMAVDVVLPLLHGPFGEDGSVQGLLESARLPYAGSGIRGSALGMDKDLAKRVWVQAGLPVVRWRTRRIQDGCGADSVRNVIAELGLPLFVKPANAGSSVGVRRVHDRKDVADALREAWKYGDKALVEQAVDGREIECSVLGGSPCQAFPPGEILPAGTHEFYDYEAKYTDPDGALLQVPADLPEAASRRIRELAVLAHVAVEAGGLSRVDFLLEHRSGQIYISEINTMPGMTGSSLFPRMTAAGGLGFTAMLDRILTSAMEDFHRREAYVHSYRREPESDYLTRYSQT